MKIRPQIVFSLLVAPVVLCIIDLLERWMRARFSGPSPDVPDVFFVWCQLLLRLAIGALLIALVWLVLYRPPGFLVASVYLVMGTLFTLARLLILSRAQSVVLAIPGSVWVIAADDWVQFIFPFFIALGVAAFIRSYVASHRHPAQSSASDNCSKLS